MASDTQDLGIASALNKSLRQYVDEATRIRALPAYRRLSGLYQFAINYNDDRLQNRQTHTEYVAETARRIAEKLGLNEQSQQLAANIGLIHDIGHPPFSHWGETAINKRLAEYGAQWNHDTAGLQTVTTWSITAKQPYGAALSAETLEGLTKRFWKYDPSKPVGRDNHSLDELPPSILSKAGDGLFRLNGFNHLEGQIAAQSDRLSFNATDIQDGLLIGRFTPEMLMEHFPSAYRVYETLLQETIAACRNATSHASDKQIRDAILRDPQLHNSVFAQFAERFRAFEIDDIVANTRTNIDASMRIHSAEDIRHHDKIVATFSPQLEAEIRSFSGFCKTHIFPKATAPFEPIVDAAIDQFMNGTVLLAPAYQKRFDTAVEPKEKMLIIAEYMTRELSDRDILTQIQQHAPEVYQQHFPGYESITHAPLSQTELTTRLTKLLKNAPPKDIVGMPTIFANQLDFSGDKSIPVISDTRKYILPIPDQGETVKIPHGLKYSGLGTRKGEPIFDAEGKPFSGKGIAVYNPEDHQWVAARTGKEGDDREVFIINGVTRKEIALLDAKRQTWGNPDKPTVTEINAMLKYASTISMAAGHGNIPQDGSSILKTIYPSQVGYVKRALKDAFAQDSSLTSLYGAKERKKEMVCRAVYIDHPFELFHKYGHSERTYHGAMIVDRGEGDYGIVQNFRAERSYKHADGRKLKISDIPVQPLPYSQPYQTSHDINGRTMTTINIVGSGVSGIAAATHIIEAFRKTASPQHALRFQFVDSAANPAGPTYNRPDANIVGMANPIGILGIDKENGCVEYFNKDPKKWMNLIPELADGFDPITQTFDPNTIITHNHYGIYARDHFQSLINSLGAEDLPIEVDYISDRVYTSKQENDTSTLTLKSGIELRADATIFCTGNALPRPIPSMDNPEQVLDSIDGYNRLDDQAWAKGNINESDETVILGTANGALFGALWAVGNGYKGKFTLISNSGKVPEIAGESKPYTRSILTLDALKQKQEQGETITADTLKALFDEEVKTAKELGGTWRDVVDSMAPETNRIWHMLSPEEQRRFTSSYGTLWNNARYRIPNEHWSEVQKLQAEGKLEIAGGLKGIRPLAEGGFEVHLTNPDGSERVIHATKIVNNTGPSKRLSEMPGCIQDLVKSGDARQHPGGGIDADADFHLIGKNGDVTKGIYAMGPIVSGAHLEAITVPAIRANAHAIAQTIMKDIVQKKEAQHDASLQELKQQYAAPKQAEVEQYAKEFIATGTTTDPRNPNRKNIIPTTEIYAHRDENGVRVYSPERLAVHQEIIDKALAWNPVKKCSEEKTPSGAKPSFICVSGGMSVGMTYMQRLMINDGIVNPENTVIITPLSFMPMQEFAIRSHYQHPEKSPLLVDEYYDVAQKIVDEAMARGLNVMFVDQADVKAPILSMAQSAKAHGYDTAMMGMTMTPEAYYDASELWLHKFNRLPDHTRGFGDLQEHASHWEEYSKAFDTASLFETYFHVKDIDKAEDDPTRKEYTVKRIATSAKDAHGMVQSDILEPQRYEEFKDRARYLTHDATTPEQARAHYPYKDARQLSSDSDGKASRHPGQLSEGIAGTMERFMGGDFEKKFVDLVRATSENRANAAASRGVTTK